MSRWISSYDELPAEIQEAGPACSPHGDLFHLYDPERDMWLAHCTNAGCGAAVDEFETEPARDFLCDSCETAGVAEE